MTYKELLKRCRRTMDLYEDSDVQLRDIAKIMARNYSNAHSVAALYACLWSNVVEYLENMPPPAAVGGNKEEK